MSLVSLLFSFNGRINRTQYWLGCIIAGFGGAVLLFILSLVALPPGGFPKTPDGFVQFMSSVSFAFGIPMVLIGWAGSALQTKRFHDRGRSGLFTLLPYLPMTMIVSSLISGMVTGANPEHVGSSIMMWILLLQLINLFMFVDLGCMPGKAEPNKYGNPPGGGFTGGGGAPVGSAPIPGQASSRPSQPVPGMGSTLTNAESAIERAIAARGKQQQAAPAAASPAPVLRPAMATAAAQPAAGLRPAAAGSFGRKAPR